MLELNERLRTDPVARERLRELAEGLAQQGCGLDPLDVDRVLASSLALGSFPQSFGEPLLDLALQLDELARSDEGADPRLSPALAGALLALRRTEAWRELPERGELLAHALDFLGRLPRDAQRDAFGVALCELGYEELGGGAAEVLLVDALERGLLAFAQPSAQRGVLLAALASVRTVQGRYGSAWRLLLAAEEALTRLTDAAETRVRVERMVASARCQLELASGLAQEAQASLGRERAALEQGANDPPSLQSYLLDLCAVGFQYALPGSLRACLDELDTRIDAWGEVLASSPGVLSSVHARRAILQLRHEQQTGTLVQAPALLAEAFADPELDLVHRTVVGLLRVDLLLEKGQPDAAQAILERCADAEESLPLEVRLGLVARRLAVAVRRAPSEAERAALLAQGRKAVEQHLVSFEEAPLRPGGLGLMAGNSRQRLLGAMLELLDGRDSARQAFELAARFQAAGSLARSLAGTSPVPLVTLEEVRALLPERCGMLVYLRTGSGAHLLVLDRETLAVVPIPSTLDARALELSFALARSPVDESQAARQRGAEAIRKLARELSDAWLPRPARDRLAGWSGVYFVGEDVLSGLPPEILELDGKPLWRTHDVASLPSLPVGVLLARGGAPRGKRVLTCAATEPAAEGLVDLPLGDEDRRRLELGAGDLVGSRATWPALVTRLAEPDLAVLHLIAHGFRERTREIPVGLALARSEGFDGNLYLEHLLAQPGLRFPPLVVLSACSAARGPLREGDDGLAQLSGGILSRGARVVVQAENEVALDAAVLLVSVLQREYLAGVRAAAALRVAREELEKVPGLEHPFYLYSLRVTGLGLEGAPKVRR